VGDDTLSSDALPGTTEVSATDSHALAYYVMAMQLEESIYIMGVEVD